MVSVSSITLDFASQTQSDRYRRPVVTMVQGSILISNGVPNVKHRRLHRPRPPQIYFQISAKCRFCTKCRTPPAFARSSTHRQHSIVVATLQIGRRFPLTWRSESYWPKTSICCVLAMRLNFVFQKGVSHHWTWGLHSKLATNNNSRSVYHVVHGRMQGFTRYRRLWALLDAYCRRLLEFQIRWI